MSQVAVAVTNWISTILVKPGFLPRMNFAGAIPPSSKTMIVVPTLIGSLEDIEDLVENMEVQYLSNPQEHLHYGLLTDLRDHHQEFREEEEVILLHARNRIQSLNRKYHREFQ
jgi:hypothetical protein